MTEIPVPKTATNFISVVENKINAKKAKLKPFCEANVFKVGWSSNCPSGQKSVSKQICFTITPTKPSLKNLLSER